MILLVVFGPPNQLATVLALAGADPTVALKDFIVGFFGWFVLMGRNRIRIGDWVEINGVAGEVVEIGLLHTVLLETGNWTDAGHPTGRRVSFVNSYAIEDHYFNFPTLWSVALGRPSAGGSVRGGSRCHRTGDSANRRQQHGRERASCGAGMATRACLSDVDGRARRQYASYQRWN